MNCKNCNTEINSKFCPDCGQPTNLKRIDGHYIIHEIEHVLHFERGILYTIRELITNPGPSIRNFLTENRSRLVKPVVFIVITSLIYTIISQLFHVEDGYINFNVEGVNDKIPVTTSFFKWVQAHYGYANIGIGVFTALWAKLFFKKYNYNFFEILIMLCFVMGIGMLFFAILAIFEGLTHIKVLQGGSILALIYSVWAMGHFFDKKKMINYIKAFFVNLLGFFSALLISTAIAILIDSIMTKQ